VDTLTHALSGALLARAATRPGQPARRVAVGFLACAAPDLDFLWTSGSALQYIEHHRGITHSLLLMPLWAVGLAWLLAKLVRHPGGWRSLYGLCVAALALHVAADLITSFGTMILAPFSSWRAALGTTFIIDLWFSGIIVAGLLFCLYFRRSRIPAVAALGVLAAYVALQFVLRERALDFAAAHALAHGMKEAQAIPRPVSPFNWTVYASDGDKHDVAHINLIRRTPKSWHPGEGFITQLDAAYRPLSSALWTTRYRYGTNDRASARAAWNSDALAGFRSFAVLPAFDGKEGDCYSFVDLRFEMPGRVPTPFRFGACRSADGWRAR
jgi:inner membrane protein